MKRTLAFIMLLAATLPLWSTSVVENPTSTGGTTPSISQLMETATSIDHVGGYAEGFSAYRSGDLVIVQVNAPWQNASPEDRFVYLLYPRNQVRPHFTGVDAVIAVPAERVITMSTTFLPHLEALGVLNALVAVDSLAWAYSPLVRERGASGDITEVGSGPAVDIERVLALEPDFVMVNSYGGEWDAQPILEAAGVPTVVLGDWVESNPLGRAEWLLFTALLFGDLDEAVERLRTIEERYLELKEIAAGASERPTVLVNAPYQGTWSVPGGKSYAATFVADAAGDYFWADDDSTGSLFLDMESVYALAGSADIWINPGTWSSLAQGEAEDARFATFAAFGFGHVYNNNRRLSPAGGNDYHESGALNPDLVLADLVTIFHPDLMPNHRMYYYRRLP
jgi:iron complex transport system substrate-binding protein